MSSTPISDYGLLSDCHSAVLVSRQGSIDWWCLPRFDSPSVFGRLLDDDAGHFSLRVPDADSIERHYVGKTLVIETTFSSPGGRLIVTDLLALAEGARGHEFGKDSPHRLVRMARCVEGDVAVEVVFRPRFEYGLTVPAFVACTGGLVARGGGECLVLSSSTELEVVDDTAATNLAMGRGDELWLSLEHGSGWESPPPVRSRTEMAADIDGTVTAWETWSEAHQRYRGPYADSVELGGRVLHALTFAPTGAILAAPTTSLPEDVGGERNWDYRYSWVRDASLTLHALWVAACPDEEGDFFRFLATAATSAHHRQEIQIMFGIGGERDLTEHELSWLGGWRGSRPVRKGNGAWNQRQNDVYGHLLDAAFRLRHLVAPFDQQLRHLLTTAADIAAAIWTEPDQGIWEMRNQPRHHLFSKLMCWVALDRAIALADELAAHDRIQVWRGARAQIRSAILDRGWNEDLGAFTQSFESTELDASVLTIPIVGFLPPDDPRVLSTIDAVERGLGDGSGLLHRYRCDDGLEGEEGAFLLCSFWLAEALAMSGQVERARGVFERALAFSNDLGLLSEQVAWSSGELLGNFPQAFSHVGVVNAAWAIAEAEGAISSGRSVRLRDNPPSVTNGKEDRWRP